MKGFDTAWLREHNSKRSKGKAEQVHTESENAQQGRREGANTGQEDVRVQSLCIMQVGPSLNAYDRMHYKKRGTLTSRWHKRVARLAKEQGLKAVERYPVHVEVECHFGKGKVRFDWDNLSPTAKLVQDGLVHAGILKNDSAPHIEQGSMRALKTRGDSYTIFRIIERLAA